jgi:hypothetical protein
MTMSVAKSVLIAAGLVFGLATVAGAGIPFKGYGFRERL